MKKNIAQIWVIAAGILCTPFVVAAAGLADDAYKDNPLALLMINFAKVSESVLIPFILAIGFLVFVWGMFRYFIAGATNDDARAKGKSLMIYAVLGYVLVIIFWGVVALIATSTGYQGEDAPDLKGGPASGL